MADVPEREDPVLVRPYITTEPGGSSARPDYRHTETWPESATLPDDHTREMALVPAPASERDPADRNSALLRQRLIVLAGIGALALVAVVAFVVFGTPDGDDPPPTAQPTLAAPSVTGALGAAPAASATARSARPSSRSSNRSPATGANPAGNGTASTRGTPEQATKPAPSATLAPPPEPARAGAITAASGRCLTLGGIFAFDGSPVQTASCTDGSSQQWTMASDGTLIVEKKCAQVGADGAVRVAACDDGPAAQWRAGPNGSLVNPETGRCLTDPGTAGATTQVTACTGAADQRWKLP